MKKETILLLLLVFFFSFISSIYFSSALTNNEIGQLIASGLNNNVKLNDTLGNNSVYDLNQQYNPNPILNQSQFTGNQEINTQNKPVMNNVSGSSVRSAKTSVSNNGPASSVPTGKVVVSAADIDSIVVYNGSKNINFADDLKTKHNTGSSDVKTFWNPFSGSNNAGLTGHVVSVDKNVVTTDINGNQSDLPAYPSTPGTTSDVVAKKGFSLFGFLSKCLKSITGWSIIGIPNWAYDGSIENNYVWTAGYTPAALGVQHFKLSLSANMSVPNAVNGLVYNKGYYLGNNLTQWEPFNFQGTVIGNTAWLRTTGNDLAPKAMADITVDKNDSKDYSIFLAYSCLKLMNSDWNCNNGKWIIFVVPTGNVSYNQAVGSTPAMGYTSVADLNVSDIPSVLKQLNLTLAQFQPELDDAQVIAPQTDINSTVGQVETLPFYVTNLGNKHNITNLTFDFDIGQSSVAQVVAANIPSFLALNQTAQGSISVQFKQAGNYQFHLYLQPQLHEVDTSDNGLTFYANVSSNSTASVVTVNNSLVNTPNTTINYSIAEPYSYTPFYGNSSLYIISGTDKMRTVFGGYFNGTSINPTLRVNIKPQVTFEAISSAPFFNSIDISGSMLTGDRESVNYYVVIKNMNNSKNYTTPIMQSMYKYYYDPKTLIPDFQFCVDYTATVVLSGSSMETTDIIEPKPFNLCNPTIVLNDFKTKRLQKLDGDYVVVTGGFSSKYFEDTNVQYYINFTDPQSYYGSYITPIINSSQGFAVFKLQDIGLTRYVNYAAGETFPGKVVLVGAPTPRNNATFNKSASFVWNGWTVNQNLNTLFLLKDEKSYIYSSTPSYSYMPGSGSQSSLYQINYIQFPDYLGQDVKDQIAAETVTEYKIVDENTQAILYDNILNASNSNGNLKSLELSNWYSFNSRYGGSCGLTLNNFTSGHVYTFTTTVLSSNADKFVAAPPLSILYLDGFQTLVNNPILRTRFINLDNFPVSFDIGGGLSKSYVPSIKLWYGPKDMFPNLTSHTLQKQNNLRLISLDQLQAFPSAYSGESNFSKAYDLQTGLHITITPLSNYSGPSSRNQFNCQLGEFSLVCDRDTGGYYINYYDSQNGFLYSIVVSNMELLKEYRDNNTLYDSLIYDILSQISNNPIKSLSNPYYVAPYDFGPNIIYKVTSTNNVYDVTKKTTGYQCPGSIVPSPVTSISWGGGNTGVTTWSEILHAISLAGVGVNSGMDINNISVKLTDQNGNVTIINNVSTTGQGSWTSCLNGFPCQASYDNLNNNTRSLNLSGQYNLSFVMPSLQNISYIVSTLLGDQQSVYASLGSFDSEGYYSKLFNQYGQYMRKIPALNSTILPLYYPENLSSTYYYYDSNNLLNNNTCFNGLNNSYLSFASGKINNMYWGGSGGWPSSNILSLSPSFGPTSSFYGYNANSFVASFVVNPSNITYSYPGEMTTLNELQNNTFGDRRLNLNSNRNYKFGVKTFSNIYTYYLNQPTNNLNTYNSNISSMVCSSTRLDNTNLAKMNDIHGKMAMLTLNCQWSNANDLKLYSLDISQIYPGRSANDLYNLNQTEINDFNSYAQTVLSQYTNWYQPTAI